jgi:hypothetical protein
MAYLIACTAAIAVGLIWWWVFRAAMKDRNPGDTNDQGSSWG